MTTTNAKPLIEPVYTIPEVCEILKLSRWTIGRWIDAGKIKAVNINPDKKGRRELRVKQSVLDKLLGGAATPDDEAPKRNHRRVADKAKRKRLLTTNNYL
ncbi:MAG TPA: hypothetical protein DDZ51_18565 [Planctomycetaceae bacterium]|nr:hypothetical protein [Planctomycetaceae bacterium]